MSGKRSRDKGAIGRSNRRRGREYENELVAKLNAAGIEAKRMSRSGSPDEDVWARIGPNGLWVPCECKYRSGGFKLLDRWLGDNYALALRSDGRSSDGAWRVVQRLDDWVQR